MSFMALRHWLGRARQAATPPAPSAPPPAAPDSARQVPDRLPDPPLKPGLTPLLALRHDLCGEGFLFPDGAEEVVRLARPLGLSEASSVALLGAGSGGPVTAITAAFGAWVSGFEADPALVTVATEHCRHSGHGKRVSIAPWQPDQPDLPRAQFHHALSLFALADVAPKPVLAALAQALRPRGQLVLLDLVAAPDHQPDASFTDWARLEARSLPLPTEAEITQALGTLGCDVRVAEDVSERHVETIIEAWRALVRPMASARPSLARAKLLVAEAERWLLRVRLLQAGRIRLVRWHAIASGKTQPTPTPHKLA